jgi:hypothetical protein
VIRLVAAIAVFTGCDRRAPIDSCAADLTGEYDSAAGRWSITDRGHRLEVFPLFPDVPASELEVAPRVIELARTKDGTIRGEVRRRYMQAATSCVAKLPVRIARCADNALEVVHGDTAPPLGFAPCQWGRSEPARVERWTRR